MSSSPLAVWRRQFRHRDPLTLRIPRTLEEAAGDPQAWFEGPQKVDRRLRRSSARTRRIWNSICWLLSFGLFVAMLTAPRWWDAATVFLKGTT